ncbi:hypothetical protein IAU59_005267 [Kwoniella sp. CBS 9459]
MMHRASRQLVRGFSSTTLPSAGPSRPPPPCEACLRALRARIAERPDTTVRSRSYATAGFQQDRTTETNGGASRKPFVRRRKTSSEFSSGDAQRPASSAGPSSSRQVISSTDAALRAQFEALFPSDKSLYNPENISTRQVVQAVYPLIFRRTLRNVPDSYLAEISECVSSTSIPAGSTLTDDEVRQCVTVLGHCWTRSSSLALSDIYPVQAIESISCNYAEFIIRHTGRIQGGVEPLKNLLDLLESAITRHVKSSDSHAVPVSVSGAWAMLRLRLNITEPIDLPVNLLERGDIRAYLLNKLDELGEDSTLYDLTLDSFLSNSEVSTTEKTSADSVVLTRNQIDRKIKHLQEKNDQEGLRTLWARVRPSLTVESAALKPNEKEEILSLFLRSFKRPVSPAQASESLFQEVLSAVPRPLPRPVATTLLALRARPDGNSLKAGHEVISLDDHPSSIVNNYRSNPGDASDNLRSTWKECEEKDLRMYMIYFEGLGRLGDLDGLKETWNELVKDKRCKETYLAEESLPPSNTFPPISALNQMISACLLIPGTGPDTALDLFNQACLPSSTVPINLITINTVLRHHARQADLTSMSALFSLAEKSGLKPDVVTYTTLVQGLLRAGRLMLAKKVLEDMHRQGISPNERMCSMLIADLAKSGSKIGLAHAEEILKLMRQKQMKTNEVTWTGLIAGYFRGGWEVDAWDAVNRMSRAGFKPNRVGYNMLLRESGKGAGTGVSKLWRKMIEDGVSPNSDTYVLALTPLVLAKRWDEVDEVLREMDRRGFRPEKGALANIVARAKSRR